MANFMGRDGFQWFVGVVEDRQDPKFLGRVKVRCLGYHPDNLTKLPTADLPWAHPMNPITSATVSGVGQTPLGSVEGTWVVGFFQDGAEAQMPVIIGTLPGVPSSLPEKAELGDDGIYNGQGFQDYINGNYPKYAETDINRLAVNDTENPHSTLTIRKADRDLAVGVANVDATDIVDDVLEADDGGNWDEPETTYNAVYPKNHVMETEGGHLREFDDTPGAMRIHERHASGTGYEVDNDGTKITRVKKDNYTLVSADEYVHIQGQERHTTDGGLKVKVNNRPLAAAPGQSTTGNHYNIEVGAGANVTIEVQKGDIKLVSQQGDVNIKAGKNFNLDVAGNMNVRVLQDAIEEVTGKKDELVVGNNKKTGKRIDLN